MRHKMTRFYTRSTVAALLVVVVGCIVGVAAWTATRTPGLRAKVQQWIHK